MNTNELVPENNWPPEKLTAYTEEGNTIATDSASRPIEELFIEKYYGLTPDVQERDLIKTDYGHLVNLLTMFKESYQSSLKKMVDDNIGKLRQAREEVTVGSFAHTAFNQQIIIHKRFLEMITTAMPPTK